MTAAVLALVMMVALEPQDARPADGPGVYVQGTVFLTTQPAGTPDNGVAPALGGRSVAIGAQAGRFVTPQLAVEGEFVFGRSIAVRQTWTYSGSYSQAYRAASRDLIFNANLRWRPPGGAPLELVAGGGLAVNRVTKADVVGTYLEPSPFPSVRSLALAGWDETRHVLTLGGGLDVPIAVGRAMVIPGFRFRWVDRMSNLSREIGTSGYSFHFGGTLRAAFDRPRVPAGPRGPAYVQGTFFATTNPAGTANHRVGPALGGEAFGVAGSAGAFVTPKTAVEGEFVLGAVISAPQRFSYNWVEDYTADVRDSLVNVNVRSKEGFLEAVIGGGFTFTRTRQQNHVRAYAPLSNRPPERLPDSTFHGSTFTIGGGIDAPIQMNPRVALVPTFRFRWVPRPADSRARYFGAGPTAFQAGVTVRVRV